MLARVAYGDVALRQFEDLDILVHKSDALKVRELLRALGYMDEFQSHPDAPKILLKYQQHFSLLAPARDATVELHWTLEQGKIGLASATRMSGSSNRPEPGRYNGAHLVAGRPNPISLRSWRQPLLG